MSNVKCLDPQTGLYAGDIEFPDGEVIHVKFQRRANEGPYVWIDTGRILRGRT